MFCCVCFYQSALYRLSAFALYVYVSKLNYHCAIEGFGGIYFQAVEYLSVLQPSN